MALSLCVPAAWAETAPVFQEMTPGQISKAEARPAKASFLPASNPLRTGIASWYSETDPFINKHTANGEVFDDSKMTCASWDYAFGTLLKVTNLKNGKSVVCRVNDRGPSKRLNRMVDLSKAAFKKIENPGKGLTRVKMRVVPKRGQSPAQAFIAAKKLR